MKKLYFDYHMQIAYTEEAKECFFTIKCIPPHTKRQCPKAIDIEVCPDAHWVKGEDSFGNPQIYGRVGDTHQSFSFHVRGIVSTGLKAYEAEMPETGQAIYRYPYGLTKPGAGLTAYYKTIRPPEGMPAGDWAVSLMHRLHQDFSYEKGITTVATTAEEAWNGGRGVCQDYAHIMVALCRLAGIPARYVTGMLIGEGFSHAWVEICSGGKWYGLDPTNDMPVADSHIKLGNGRDASDCPINRGLIKGGGAQEQRICLKVEEDG